MEIEWKYSKQTEINRLLFTANRIALSIYQKLGFLLSPKMMSSTQLLIVAFPEGAISAKSWKKLSEVELDIINPHLNIDQNILTEFHEIYSTLEIADTSDIAQLQKDWNEIEKRFTKTVSQVFPQLPFEKLVISPTLYGTWGSYCIKENAIYVTFRIDTPVNSIIDLFLLAVVQYLQLPESIKNDGVEIIRQNHWHQKQFVAEFLSKHTGFATLNPSYNSTLDSLTNPEIPKELIARSSAYFSQLGFPVKPCLKMQHKTALLHEEELTNLTTTQEKILLKLLGSVGEVTSFEILAELMWGNERLEKYSLTAMSKMIFQLRQKLREAGLQKEVIFTKRGQGYVLMQ